MCMHVPAYLLTQSVVGTTFTAITAVYGHEKPIGCAFTVPNPEEGFSCSIRVQTLYHYFYHATSFFKFSLATLQHSNLMKILLEYVGTLTCLFISHFDISTKTSKEIMSDLSMHNVTESSVPPYIAFYYPYYFV